MKRLFSKDYMLCDNEVSFKLFFCLAKQIINIILNIMLKYFSHVIGKTHLSHTFQQDVDFKKYLNILWVKTWQYY